MSMEKAFVRVTLEDLDIMRDQIRSLSARVIELTKEKEQIELSKDDRIPGLIESIRAALPIIQFAVSSLPIEFPTWPWRSLHRLAELLTTIPNANQHDIELASEWKKVAKEISDSEEARKNKPKPDDADKLLAEQDRILKNYESHMEKLNERMREHDIFLSGPDTNPDIKPVEQAE